MPRIEEIKREEMSDILGFYNTVKEYGHIFYQDPKELDEPFRKIMEGIREVEQMMVDSYEM